MFSITITDQSGQRSVKVFDKPDVSIGRGNGNDIVLPRQNVSNQHARILHNRGNFVVVDSKSTNGTFVNGERIESPYVLRAADKIFVGDFVLEVSSGEAAGARVAPSNDRVHRLPVPLDDVPTSADSELEDDREADGDADIAAPAEQAEEGDFEPEAEPQGTPATRAPRSPVAVDWNDDDWDSPIDVDDAEGAAAAEAEANAEEDSSAERARSGSRAAGSRKAAARGNRRPTSRSWDAPATGGDAITVLVECLREYIELDAEYRRRAVGSDCNCGECLLCRARDALERFESENR